MPTLFTLVCEGLSPEALEAQVTDAGVSTVADLRREPDAREPGLSRRRLAERLEGAGVGYVRLERLSEGLDGPEAAEDYAVLRGLALDEDVCLLGEAADPRESRLRTVAERLAQDTGLPVANLRPT